MHATNGLIAVSICDTLCDVQVWWYAASLMKGKLVCHDLASGRTDEVVSGSTAATVLCIHLDAENNIWTGHRGGTLQVWNEGDTRSLCPMMRIDASDITCVP